MFKAEEGEAYIMVISCSKLQRGLRYIYIIVKVV